MRPVRSVLSLLLCLPQRFAKAAQSADLRVITETVTVCGSLTPRPLPEYGWIATNGATLDYPLAITSPQLQQNATSPFDGRTTRTHTRTYTVWEQVTVWQSKSSATAGQASSATLGGVSAGTGVETHNASAGEPSVLFETSTRWTRSVDSGHLGGSHSSRTSSAQVDISKSRTSLAGSALFPSVSSKPDASASSNSQSAVVPEIGTSSVRSSSARSTVTGLGVSSDADFSPSPLTTATPSGTHSSGASTASSRSAVSISTATADLLSVEAPLVETQPSLSFPSAVLSWLSYLHHRHQV
jgi:hypothetical protein